MTTSAGPRRRVLVVDDEPHVLAVLGDILVTLDYDVATASTFDQARGTLATFRPHVVLLDLRLPGISGLDALAHLRQDHPGVPVIVISGEMHEAAAERARAAGAFDVIAKPFDVRLLRELVGRAMRVAPQG